MTDAHPILRSYLPGEWYAVLAADLVVALPPDRRDLAAAVWSVLDRGAGSEEVLDVVLSQGLSGLAGCALVSTDGDRTRAIARGPVSCRLDGEGGEVVADGRTASTWVEVSLDAATAVTLELGAVPVPEAGDGPELRVADGLVRASRLGWALEAPGALETAPAVVVPPPAAPVPSAEPSPPAEPAPPAVPAEPAEPAVPATDDDAEAHDQPREADPPQQPDPPGAEEQQAAHVPADPGPVGAWSPDTDDHDGRTQDGSWSAEEFLRHQPGIPGQPPAPAVTSRPVAVLQLSTGDRVDVDRVVIVGRAPEARRFTATDKPRLVTVPSPQQEISSTHLEVRPGSGADHGSAVVTDLGSTNGTVLAQPGLPAESLKPGIPVQLLPGAVIDLGDGLSITVSRP